MRTNEQRVGTEVAPSGASETEQVAKVLRDKFGAQCGMSEIDMWRPIARAALDTARVS